MMQDAYSLSPRRARVLRVAAALFVLVGIVGLTPAVLGFALPGGIAAFNCEDASGCRVSTDLVNAAPEEDRAALRAAPRDLAVFTRHLDRPWVRLGIGGAELIRNLPFAALMIAVALALRRLAARTGQDLSRALPWLRRAAVAALVMAFAEPLADAIRESALSIGLPEGAHWTIPFNLTRLLNHLLLATAAFAVVWALDVGSRATRDVGEFV